MIETIEQGSLTSFPALSHTSVHYFPTKDTHTRFVTFFFFDSSAQFIFDALLAFSNI